MGRRRCETHPLSILSWIIRKTGLDCILSYKSPATTVVSPQTAAIEKEKSCVQPVCYQQLPLG